MKSDAVVAGWYKEPGYVPKLNKAITALFSGTHVKY